MKKNKLAIAIGVSIPAILGLGMLFIFSQIRYLSAAQTQEATVPEKNRAKATERALNLPVCAPDHTSPLKVSQWEDKEIGTVFTLVIHQPATRQKQSNPWIFKTTSKGCEDVLIGFEPWAKYMPESAAIALKTVWWKHLSETQDDFVEVWLNYPENWDSMPFYPEDETILANLGFKISEKAARANSYKEFRQRWKGKSQFIIEDYHEKNADKNSKEPE